MARELHEAWTRIETDPGVVVAIVTGAGDKAFCTGFDVAQVAAGDTANSTEESYEDSPLIKLTAIHNRCWKPVITAVNGMVNGGGLHFLADSDLVLAAEHATF